MQQWDTVAIVGVGMIGGSIGLGLKQRGAASQVIGIGRNSTSLDLAQEIGAIDFATTEMASGVKDAQLIVVCTPVACVADHVAEIFQHSPPDAVVTDAGSTKASIVHSIESWIAQANSQGDRSAYQFIGSHPLAGSEKTGPLAARGDLLEGRKVIITPTEHSSSEAKKTVEQFWQTLGAKVFEMNPPKHDETLAAISHLPHLIASALSAGTAGQNLEFAASGWLDTTRVAAGDVELWRQIFVENREGTLKSLDKFETVLAEFRLALEKMDEEKLIQLLNAGKKNRDAVAN